MAKQLFIYYRVPKTEYQLALSCAKQFIALLFDQGLGNGELFRREENNEFYVTVMEVVYPDKAYDGNIEKFTGQLEKLAAQCFTILSTVPNRHIEIFDTL
jgi:hypothetical protein